MSGLIGVSSAMLSRYAAFHASVHGLKRPAGTTVLYAMGSNLAQNRNTITETALERRHEWILFLDDDHVLPPDTLTRLLATDKAMISAHMVRREPPFGPMLAQWDGCAYRWLTLLPGAAGVIPVDATCPGCLLVKTDVFRALEPPYWRMGQLSADAWGEDLDLCTRVRAAGIQPYCDLDTVVGHSVTMAAWPTHGPDGWSVRMESQ